MTAIQESSLIRLGLDRAFMAYFLARRVGAINGTWGDLAESLGLTADKMVSLAWCKAPRANHRDEDIVAIATYVGMSAQALRELLIA